MKKRKWLRTLFIFLLVIGATAFVTYTYSKYTSTAIGTDTAPVAPWVVKVNDTDITATNIYTANEISWSGYDSYVTEGYIAPGKRGIFDIIIDPTGSKVAIEYTIDIASELRKQYPQLSLQRVMNYNGGTYYSANPDGTYSGTISLSDVQAGTKTRIYVELLWLPSSNNDSDTEIGKTIEELEIPVTVTATQYLG